eukprot:gene3319-4529_t
MLNRETHHVIPDDDNLQLPDLEAQNKLSRTSCSCLVASNQCLAGRGIATMAINKLPTFSCSVNTAAFIAAVLIPVCAMLVPMSVIATTRWKLLFATLIVSANQVLVVGAVTFYVVSEGRVAQNTLLSRGLLLVPVLLCGLGYSLQTYDLLFPGNAVLGGLAAL